MVNRKYRYLLKNIRILTISNFSSKVLVFLLVPLYTSSLTTNEYGVFDLVVSTIQLLFPILTLNIVDSVMRFSMDDGYPSKDVASIGLRYIFRSFFCVSVFLIINSCICFVDSIHGLEIFIWVYFISYGLYLFFIQLAKGLERVNDIGIASVCGTVIMLAADILGLVIFRLGLKGLLVANILAQLVPAIYIAIRLRIWRYICKVGREGTLQKDMLLYSVPLIMTTVGWWVNSVSDRYAVSFFCGIEANGILSISYKIPAIINVLQSIFIQAWQISAIKEYDGEGSKEFYGEVFLNLNFMMSVVCAGLIIVSKPLAHLLYARDFFVAWRYVPFLLISSLLNAAAGFIGPLLSAKKDSKAMARSALYGASVNILLNILLVYLMGIQGATIATAIASFIIYFVRRKAANILEVDNKTVYLTWMLLVIQAIIEIYTDIWVLEVGIILIMFFINRIIISQGITKCSVLIRK